MKKMNKSKRIEIRMTPNELDRLNELRELATEKTGINTSNSEIIIRLINNAFFKLDYFHSGIIHEIVHTEYELRRRNLETGELE